MTELLCTERQKGNCSATQVSTHMCYCLSEEPGLPWLRQSYTRYTANILI